MLCINFLIFNHVIILTNKDTIEKIIYPKKKKTYFCDALGSKITIKIIKFNREL